MPWRPDELTPTMTARQFVRELEARGLDSERALTAARLSRDEVNDVRAQVPWAQCLHLIEAALELSAACDLGVHAGTRFEVSDLDLAGLYLRSAASAREALHFYEAHRDALDPSRHTTIYTTDRAVVMSLPEHADSPAWAALAECVLATAVTFARNVLGEIAPLEVCFRHRRPTDTESHERMFGAVRFERDLDALFFPIELLDRSLPYRDDTIRSVLQPHLAREQALAQAARADLRSRALDAIRQELSNGRASLDELARRLRTSPRSLRRELAALDTSYSELLNEVRRELATQHVLESPRSSAQQIAQRLGYADPHTFYRAFKRWTGMSLSDYRKQRLG